MGKLTYQTLRENVVDVIRMKIFNHELAPGMRIIEQDISDELGVSRGPIREALRQLEQEGLVEYVRNVGCSVKNITLEDIYEIYLLRATYEILAVKLCGPVPHPQGTGGRVPHRKYGGNMQGHIKPLYEDNQTAAEGAGYAGRPF